MEREPPLLLLPAELATLRLSAPAAGRFARLPDVRGCAARFPRAGRGSASTSGVGCSAVAGWRVSGSRFGADRVGTSRGGASRLGGSRLARLGTRLGASRFGASRFGGSLRIGVSQYGHIDQRGSTGCWHEGQGSLTRARQFGQRRKVFSIGY